MAFFCEILLSHVTLRMACCLISLDEGEMLALVEASPLVQSI